MRNRDRDRLLGSGYIAVALLVLVCTSMSAMALWTPSDIVTEAWYDAADASTITASSGAVSQWSDKSGNGRAISQATSSARPTLVGDKVDFDGADDCLTTANEIIHGGAITVLSQKGASTSSNVKTLTTSFTAGAGAEKLVVTVASESNVAAGQTIVTYNGVAMTPIVAYSGSSVGLYYLDNPYTGGAADVVVTFDAGVGTVNGFALGVVSLAGTVDGGPVDYEYPGSSVSGGWEATLDVTHDGSFVIASFNNNTGSITERKIKRRYRLPTKMEKWGSS